LSEGYLKVSGLLPLSSGRLVFRHDTCSLAARRLALIGAVVALAAAPLLVPQIISAASAAAKTTYIPARWASTGEVPWVPERTKESANVILLWGVQAGPAAITGWQVGGVTTAGQSITQIWGGSAAASGTVRNAAYNGTPAAGATATFGFIGTGSTGTPALTCAGS